MHILTFDIEDWFHILDNSTTQDISQWASFPSRLEPGVLRILDFCDKVDVKATFFILGWVAEQAPEIVAEIVRRGHEIACHSYRHQLVYRQSPKEFENDLLRALSKIEAATGIECSAYRAPGFSITSDCLWPFEILARNGIRTDCSVFPAARGHGGLPGFPFDSPCLLETEAGALLEIFPMNTRKLLNNRLIFSGGGYFRLLPYLILRRWFQDEDYVMTYFHPRDFDPDQPVIPGLRFARRFKSYVGLRSALGKLETLTSDTHFISLATARSQVDWGRVPIVNVKQLWKGSI
jgi:polysaccharide deacetylase family protein (PEP-CTERM system associated)